MKILTTLLFAAAAILTNNALAQQDISGTWEGKLQATPGSEMGIEFILKRDAKGAYSAIINSPDNANIRNVPASKVQLTANRLTITADKLSGSYEGTIDKKTITGTWHQPGSDLPLNLTAVEKVAQGDASKLIGDWYSEDNGTATAFKFEMNGGKPTGTSALPDFGIQAMPLKDVSLDVAGKVTFKMQTMRGKYVGVLKGDTIHGDLLIDAKDTVNNKAVKSPMNIKKGPYVPRPPVVKLTEEMKQLLTGEWFGVRKMVSQETTYVFRFEPSPTAPGGFAGYTRQPDNGPREMPIKDMVLGDKGDSKTLMLKSPYFGEVYAAFRKNAGVDEMVLSFAKTDSVMSKIPQKWVMKKGKYVQPAPTIKLAEETKQQLLGEWSGEWKTESIRIGNSNAPLTAILRFARNPAGEFAGVMEIANMQMMGVDLTIRDIVQTDKGLLLKIPGFGIEFKPVLKKDGNADVLQGAWNERGKEMVMTFKKGKYTPPPAVVKLPAETKALLAGEWTGTRKTPQSTTAMVFQFSNNPDGFVGTVRMPERNAEAPIGDMVLTDKTLTLKMPNMAAEYSATIKKDGSVDMLDGRWKQGAVDVPLEMKKGK